MSLTLVFGTINAALLIFVLGLVWHGGKLLGTFTSAMSSLTEEVKKLREQREQDVIVMARTVELLDTVVERVKRLEDRADRRAR